MSSHRASPPRLQACQRYFAADLDADFGREGLFDFAADLAADFVREELFDFAADLDLVFRTPFVEVRLIFKLPADPFFSELVVVDFEVFEFFASKIGAGRASVGPLDPAAELSAALEPPDDPLWIPICSSIPSTSRSNGIPAARKPSVRMITVSPWRRAARVL